MSKSVQQWPIVGLLALDCDGVLTDGTVTVDATGSEQKRFSLRDGHGIEQAKQAGIHVVVVTRKPSAALAARAKKLGIPWFASEDKAQTIAALAADYGVPLERTAFVGDDVFDLPAMQLAGLGVTVADAHPTVTAAADHVTAAPGGHGAVRELIDLLLSQHAQHEPRRSNSRLATHTQRHCYVIAEIGQNHQGDLELAKELIRTAKLCGADAVKSQKRDIHSLLTPEEYSRPYDSPHAFGQTYGEHREALEFSAEQWGELFDYARGIQIDLFASAWDLPSADLLNELGCPTFKVASASLTHLALLRRYASFGRPIILSTGMSSLEEIDAAFEVLRGTEHYLLQCTSAYPAAFDSVNLRAMQSLGARYGCTVGLSGHHRGIAIDSAAVALGARLIERHFTLDRTWKGSDHAASLEPMGLSKLVRDLRAVEAALGSPAKAIQPCELPARAKLRGPLQVVADPGKQEAAA